MAKFRSSRLRWVVLVACTTLAALGGYAPLSAPTPDPAFERRLTREAVYRTRPRDTLERVAYYLYGKRTWWEKLRSQNPELKTLGAHDRIPVGTALHYRAPEIGPTYQVQPGDWLIRIVEWKYGDREKWEQVFQLNSKHLSNPNLILPGDIIDMTADGRVTHRGTGAVLMNAQEQLKTTGPWFGAGFFIGLGGLVVFWAVLRRVSSADVPELLRPGHIADEGKSRARVTRSTVAASQVHSEDYPYGFKKHPLQLYRADWKPVADREGTVEKRLGYHRITKARVLSAGKKKKSA